MIIARKNQKDTSSLNETLEFQILGRRVLVFNVNQVSRMGAHLETLVQKCSDTG